MISPGRWGVHLLFATMALSPLMEPRGAVSRVRGIPWFVAVEAVCWQVRTGAGAGAAGSGCWAGAMSSIPLGAASIMRRGGGMSRRSCEPRAASCEPREEEAASPDEAASGKLQATSPEKAASYDPRAGRGEATRGIPPAPSRHRCPTPFLRITHHALSSRSRPRSRSPLSSRVTSHASSGTCPVAALLFVGCSVAGGRVAGFGMRGCGAWAPLLARGMGRMGRMGPMGQEGIARQRAWGHAWASHTHGGHTYFLLLCLSDLSWGF